VVRSDGYFDMGLRVTRSIASASGLLYDNSSVLHQSLRSYQKSSMFGSRRTSYVGNISLPGDSVYMLPPSAAF
jgi:hypothetical protein